MRAPPRRTRGELAAVVLALTAAACSESASQAGSAGLLPGGPDGGRLVVATVNYPLAYLVEHIGGDAVEVVFPVPPDADPAFWQPEPADVVRFQQADLILLNGAGYASWTRTASLPLSRSVDTSEAFADRLIQREHAVTHSHGPEGEHAHGGTAFTTWLDPEFFALHAAAVRDALAARRPAQAAAFEARFAELEAELQALDARIAAAVAQSPERAVLFSHPVYDYLIARYAIDGTSLHLEPDEPPSAAQWAEIERLAAERGAHWMVWESEPLTSTVEGLQERGVQSAVFDPCANRPVGGELGRVLTSNAAALEQVFAEEDGPRRAR